jgi:hypothetical protein
MAQYGSEVVQTYDMPMYLRKGVHGKNHHRSAERDESIS